MDRRDESSDNLLVVRLPTCTIDQMSCSSIPFESLSVKVAGSGKQPVASSWSDPLRSTEDGPELSGGFGHCLHPHELPISTGSLSLWTSHIVYYFFTYMGSHK